MKKVKSSDKSSDRGDNALHTEKCQDHIPSSLAYQVVCADDKFSKAIVLYIGKSAVDKFIKGILDKYDYWKKVMKKHFFKKIVISAEDEEKFQLLSNNKSWICDKLVFVGGDKVRDHCHVTGKYRGSAHWSCNVNVKLTKEVPVIFHHLKSYDSHLIMQEIDKFDAN